MNYKEWLYSRFDPEITPYLDVFYDTPWPVKVREIDTARATLAVSLRYDYFADPEIFRTDTPDFINEMPVNYLEVFIGLIFNCSYKFAKEYRDDVPNKTEDGKERIVVQKKGYTAAMKAILSDTVKKAGSNKLILSSMLKDIAKGKFRPFIKIKVEHIEDLPINDQFYIYLATKKIIRINKGEIDYIVKVNKERIENPNPKPRGRYISEPKLNHYSIKEEENE